MLSMHYIDDMQSVQTDVVELPGMQKAMKASLQLGQQITRAMAASNKRKAS